jgi:hypothetical protein
MEEVVTKCPEISLSLLQDVSLFQPLVSLLVLPPWSCYMFQQKVVFHIYNLLHYILFFTNHSYFDLENACDI